MTVATSDRAEGWRPDQSDLEAILEYYHDRPVEFIEALGFTLSDTQREILYAIRDHDRVMVWSGNGTGKTAGVMMGLYWYVMTRYNSLGMATSGNYAVLNDTSWPFLQQIHKRAKEHLPALAAEATAKQSPPRIDFDDYPEWWIRFRSPTYPENLEGRHGRRAMVVIDEADKDDVTEAHFSSATSTASSADDVVVAIANPPEDRSNVAYQKWNSDRWHNIEFSSFDSHNVKKSLGELPDDDTRGHIPGLVDLSLVKEDYVAWNGYEWPGAEAARDAVTVDESGRRIAYPEHDRDLDPRWYRKRLGVLPPSGQGTLRPFYESQLDDAVARYRNAVRNDRVPVPRSLARVQLGTDIARDGGDRTVAVARYDEPKIIDIAVDKRPGDHTRNFDILSNADSDRRRTGPWVIDAVGEGSGVADRLRATRSNVRRFDGGEDAKDEDEYYNRATEAYVHLGQWIKNGGMVPPNTDLERELRAAARTITLNEKSLRGGTTLHAKGKDALKKSNRLGRSPDVLDAAAYACYRGYSTEFHMPNVGGAVG